MKTTVSLPITCLAVFLSLGALSGCASDGGKGSDSGESGGLVGNPAPDFSVQALSNAKGTIALKSMRGKVVLIDFWGTFCDPCKKSFPKLQDLNTKFAASGLQIIGISEDEADDKDKIPGFGDTYGAKFAVGWDTDKTIARSYEPKTMPSSYIIDKKGVVRFVHVGYHDGEEVEVEKEIKELLGQ